MGSLTPIHEFAMQKAASLDLSTEEGADAFFRFAIHSDYLRFVDEHGNEVRLSPDGVPPGMILEMIPAIMLGVQNDIVTFLEVYEASVPDDTPTV